MISLDGDTTFDPQSSARPEMTLGLTRGITRMLIDQGLAVLAEFPLVNQRRADLIGLSPKGEITIVEIKSCRADFEVDTKWPDYLDFCDHFFFGVSEGFDPTLLPDTEGMIIADAFGGDIIRDAVSRKLSAPRRKAVTLRFARLAALRATVR